MKAALEEIQIAANNQLALLRVNPNEKKALLNHEDYMEFLAQTIAPALDHKGGELP